MRKITLLIVVVTLFSVHRSALAQVQELPMVPLVTGGWQEKFWSYSDGTKFHYFEMGTGTQPYTRTHRLWREAKNFQRVILRNRGHLSSYMAGLAPELYRDSLTDFIVRNNPKK